MNSILAKTRTTHSDKVKTSWDSSKRTNLDTDRSYLGSLSSQWRKADTCWLRFISPWLEQCLQHKGMLLEIISEVEAELPTITSTQPQEQWNTRPNYNHYHKDNNTHYVQITAKWKWTQRYQSMHTNDCNNPEREEIIGSSLYTNTLDTDLLLWNHCCKVSRHLCDTELRK